MLISPDFIDSDYHWTLDDQGKLEEAIAAYQKALRLDPNYAIAHYNLGNTLKAQGKLEEAIAELEIAVRLDPSSTVEYELLSKNSDRLISKLEHCTSEYELLS